MSDPDTAPLRGRTRAPTARNAVIPKDKTTPLKVEEKLERDLAKLGIGRCALCPWEVTGTMKEVIAAQAEHRAEHDVESHPDVLRISRNCKLAKASLAARRARSARARSQPTERP